VKIVIPGGSGQVGTLLGRAFRRDGHEVVEFSRNPSRSRPWRVVAWDGESLGPWAAELEGADAVINLAGRSVNCRYTPENRCAITQSRVASTRVIGKAIAQAARPPRVWLQAATATIYCHRFDAANDEARGILGGSEPGVPDTWNFSVGVATAWERAAAEAGPLPSTRLVLMRTSIVMNPDPGSAFDVLLTLVRFGLGGRASNGRQYVSWIHEIDFIRAVNWILAHPDLSGPVNLAAPNPLPNAAFMQGLRRAWGAPLGLPAAAWMLEIGAFFLRTETELILKSRRVIPTRLLESGFHFTFPEWPAAASELCERWRAGKESAPR